MGPSQLNCLSNSEPNAFKGDRCRVQETRHLLDFRFQVESLASKLLHIRIELYLRENKLAFRAYSFD